MTAALRWSTASVCLLLAVSVACVPLTSPATATAAVGPAVGVGLAGVALLALSLAGWTTGIGPSVVLVAAGYGVSLIGHGSAFDTGVVLVAPAVVIVAELAYWSLDARTPGAEAVWARRAGLLAAQAAVAVIAAAAVEAAVALPSARGFGLSAAGVGGAIGILVIAGRVGRPSRAKDPASGR